MVCAGGQGGGACKVGPPPYNCAPVTTQGDSGGPLTVDVGRGHVLVGVVSHGAAWDTSSCGQVSAGIPCCGTRT